jgi:hypothetical protein
MKHNQRLGFYALTLALLTADATGCSGINASKSVSPIDFLLPGLMENSPASPGIPIEHNPAPVLARANQITPVDLPPPNLATAERRRL